MATQYVIVGDSRLLSIACCAMQRLELYRRATGDDLKSQPAAETVTFTAMTSSAPPKRAPRIGPASM
jgi:hypothetical protein